jgi:hypothetical protein
MVVGAIDVLLLVLKLRMRHGPARRYRS